MIFPYSETFFRTDRQVSYSLIHMSFISLFDRSLCKWAYTLTVEPRFNEPLFNEVFNITNDILGPSKSYSKMYGIEPRYNEHNPEAWT